VVGYAAVFALILLFPTAGIGLPQAFYVPIVLASLSGGPATGATAGLIATLLYEAALRNDQHGEPPGKRRRSPARLRCGRDDRGGTSHAAPAECSPTR